MQINLIHAGENFIYNVIKELLLRKEDWHKGSSNHVTYSLYTRSANTIMHQVLCVALRVQKFRRRTLTLIGTVIMNGGHCNNRDPGALRIQKKGD